jgi:hypothetical protein
VPRGCLRGVQMESKLGSHSNAAARLLAPTGTNRVLNGAQ